MNPGTWQQYVQRPDNKGLSITLLERRYTQELYQYQMYLMEVVDNTTTTTSATSAGGRRMQATEAPLVITDSDVLAFVSATGITDNTQKSAVNTLVTSLKGYSIWTKLNAIYPFIGGTASTHKWNLKDPRDLDAAYRLSFTGGWTHNANGITGNGTNAYADTFYAANPINTIGAYNRTSTISLTLLGATATFIDGDGYQTNPFGLVLKSNSIQVYQTTFSAGSPTPAGITVSRTAGDGATAIKVYRNGIQNSTGNNTDWTLFSLQSLAIGARRQDDYDDDTLGNIINTIYVDYSIANIALAFMGNTALTGTEVANLNTAIVAYQTTLGRQI